MKEAWFQHCLFTPEQERLADVGLSRLQDVLPIGVTIDEANGLDIVVAAGRMMGRARSEWSLKNLYIWATYYDWLDNNPEKTGCDTDWFVGTEKLGAWPEAPFYPASFEELFESFISHSFHGAEKTRMDIRSILKTLVILETQIYDKVISVEDLINFPSQLWPQLELVVSEDFAPASQARYLGIYRDLYKYIQAQGYREGLPFVRESREFTHLSKPEAVEKLWGSMVEIMPVISQDYTWEHISEIYEDPRSTRILLDLVKHYLKRAPRYEAIDVVIHMLEIVSMSGERQSVRQVKDIIDIALER